MRVISPLDLRRSLGAILDAASAGERFVIERDRRPLAMLVSVEDGRRLDPDPAEARRRRLAAIDRLEALAAASGSARARATVLEPAPAREPAIAPPTAAPPPAIAPPPAAPPPEIAPPTAAPPTAGQPTAGRATVPGPAAPSRAAPAPARADRHEVERRRHAGEGLVGLG
jgi:antitoxin (DNA-binding transcriptional repressor) of toxin-antitoxin stability system